MWFYTKQNLPYGGKRKSNGIKHVLSEKNQMNGLQHLLSGNISLGRGKERVSHLWAGEEMQSTDKILGRGWAWGGGWHFSASILYFSAPGNGSVKRWMSTNGKQELPSLWLAFLPFDGWCTTVKWSLNAVRLRSASASVSCAGELLSLLTQRHTATLHPRAPHWGSAFIPQSQ